MNESSRSDLKLILFVFCCIGFAFGIAAALVTIWEACCSPGFDFGGDSGSVAEVGVLLTFAIDWLIGLLLFALAFVQGSKRRWLQFGMAATLAVLPLVAKWTFDIHRGPPWGK